MPSLVFYPTLWKADQVILCFSAQVFSHGGVQIKKLEWLSSDIYANTADPAHSLVFCLDKR